MTSRSCPLCGKPRTAQFNPFCSRRCADVDLAHWLKGTYVIAGETKDNDEDEDRGSKPISRTISTQDLRKTPR